MTERQKTWLKAMYDEEIRQAAGAAANEAEWAKGAPTHEAAWMHVQNADEHHGYARILEKLKSQVDGMQEEGL